MDYKILKASNIGELEIEVKKYIEMRWKPFGNMTSTRVNINPSSYGWMGIIESEYCQPMIRE